MLAELARPELLSGLAVAAVVIVGLYVVSQVYQTRDDRLRGDRTWPVLLGPAAALRWATLVSGVGGALLLALLGRAVGWWSVAPLALLLALLGAAQLAWAAHFDEDDVEGNFRRAMAVVGTGGVGLTLFLLVVLLR